MEALDRGDISIDTIEEALGGKDYAKYQEAVKSEAAAKQEYDTLANTPKNQLSHNQEKRLAELEKQLENEPASSALKTALEDNARNLAKNSRFMSSYTEKANRSVKFEADVNKYSEKERAIVQKAIDSGLMNNTRRTHDFVDLVAKLSAKTGVDFNFVNNAKLKESGYSIEGKTVNGFVTKDGVTLNVDSNKMLDAVVGHEVTHVLEGTELYSKLQEAVFKYARTKGDYETRLAEMTELYKGVKDANINGELTAELVGEYLFKDNGEFVNSLLDDRNLLQKIYDEIKYLVSIATAGSQEERELKRVEKLFRDAIKSGGKQSEGVKYSLDEYTEHQKENWKSSKRIVVYESNEQLEQFIQDAISDNRSDKKMYFGAIPADLAAKIQADTGLNVEKYNLSLGAYEIRKILKDHGDGAKEALRGQRAIQADDFAHIVDVVLNPTSIELSDQTYMGKPAIIFKGNYNGRMNVVAVVSDKRLDLFVQTIYANTKKENLATPTGEQAPINTPEANSGIVFSKDNVAQKEENVKLSLSADGATYAEITQQQMALNQRDNALRERKREAQNNPELLQAMDDVSSIFDEMRELLPKKKQGTATQAELDRIEELKALREERIARVAEIQETLGLNAISKEEKEIRKEREALRVAADEAWAREGAEKENAAIEKSGLPAQEYFRKKALKAFKTTANFNEAGYLLPDGKMLNFSGGERNHRYRDHREIGEIYEATNGVYALNRFLNDGNIRVMAESPGVDIAAGVEPTAEQYAAIRRFVKSHGTAEAQFFVDFSGEDGRKVSSYSYEGKVNADRVINDIKYYYATGEVREQSDIGRFLSLSPENERQTGRGISGGDIALEDAPIRADIAPDTNTETNTENRVENAPSASVPKTAGITEAEVSEKVKALKTELYNDIAAREKAYNDFADEITRLQAEYNSKRNKNTRVANDILRRIERTQRMQASVDSDYAKRINNLEQRIDKMSQPAYKTAMQRAAKQEQYTRLMEKLVGETTSWVDKKLGISYKVNTLRRNLRDIVRKPDGTRNIKLADAIYDELQGKYNQNEAKLNREATRIKNPFAEANITKAEDAYIQMLGELRHNPETTLTEEMVSAFYEANKATINQEKVDKLIADARKTYDELLKRVNEVLREQGMKEIPYRKGYFPHFTEEKQGFVAKLLNWKTQNNNIPTDIAGLTEQFNPNRSWQAFNKQRKGDTTDYSFTKGLDTYVQGALDWIYHIEDIQKRRAFENYIRYVHSEKGVQEKIDALRKSEEYDADELQAQIDLIYREAANPLNNFVTDLRAGTNRLANKKSSMDRGFEEATNRKFYSTMTNISNRVSANMVGGSISSALTNFIPITQSWGTVSPKSSLRAMRDTIASAYRDDGLVNQSVFLTNRLRKAENLYKSGWDKVSDKIGIMMEAVDSFTSQTVWRSKYIENIDAGMSVEAAIKNADEFAESVMAGRSRGNMPTIFESKNPLIKTLTAFQLEVANQYGYMFKDMPLETKNDTVGKLVKGYATMFLGAYAYNALYSSIVGRDSAFDPIGIIEDLLRDMGLLGDDEEEPADILLNLTDNVLQEVPFVGGLLGGGRIPISSALPYDGLYEAVTGTITDVAEQDWENLTNEWLNPLYYLALPMAGGQIRKTTQGLSMFDDDLPIAGSYTQSGALRFPVEDNLGNRLKAAVFGQYASKNAREYFDNGYAPLKEKQIQEFIDSDLPIAEYRDYREGLKGKDTLAEKAEYIASLDLPIDTKNMLVNNVADREEPIDLTGFEEYGDFEAFEYAHKYSGKYAVSKAVTGDLTEYRAITKALGEITSDKDENDKTINGSRRNNVINYINSLDIEYGAKLILYKQQYKADDTYNRAILEYLQTTDLSRDDKLAICRELGFSVAADGTIRW